MTRFDAGEVEHLVDELQQVAPPRQDVAHALRLVAAELVHAQELGEAEDAVERGAQLVAHAGEELALGLVRPLRLCAPLLHPALEVGAQGCEVVLGMLLLGDVLYLAEEIAGVAEAVADHRAVELRPHHRAVRAQVPLLGLEHLSLTVGHLPQLRQADGDIVGMGQVLEPHAHQGGLVAAQHLAQGGVDPEVPAV